MEQFIQNILEGVRLWVNQKLEDISFVVSSHINDLTEKLTALTGRVTTAETKLSGIEDGAEVNIIETVKVDGVALTPDANKAVDITIPVKGVKAGEKIIGLDANDELSSTLTIDLVDGTGADANKKFIRLLGIPGEGGTENVVDTVDVSSLITDGMLEAAGFYRYHAAVADPATPAYWQLVSGDEIAGHGTASEATTWQQAGVDGQEYIVLKWNTAADSKMTFINAAELIDPYVAGTGLTLTGHTFSLNAATSTTIGGVYVEAAATSGLTLAADGKLSIVGPTSQAVYNFLVNADDAENSGNSGN